jgi:hypothetical protein
MAPRPKPQKSTQVVDGDTLILYVKPSEVAPYIGTITPDPPSLMLTATETVKSHSRRRYVGGPAKSVIGHSRSRTSGDKAAGLTLPGNNAWLERKTGTPLKTVREQITFVGSFASLKQFCKDSAAIPFVLRSPWGEPFQISVPD